MVVKVYKKYIFIYILSEIMRVFIMPALLRGLDFGSSLYNKNLKSIHKIHSMIGSGVLVAAYIVTPVSGFFVYLKVKKHSQNTLQQKL